MSRNKGDKLTEPQKILLRQCIVQGWGYGQINRTFVAHGWEKISSSTLWNYRNDPEVLAQCEAVTRIARLHGMANRFRLIEYLSENIQDVRHRKQGTTPHKDDIELVDEDMPRYSVDTGTYIDLGNYELKLLQMLIALTTDSVPKSTASTSIDVEGYLTSKPSYEPSIDLRRTAFLAQMNDMMEMAIKEVENMPDADPPLHEA